MAMNDAALNFTTADFFFQNLMVESQRPCRSPCAPLRLTTSIAISMILASMSWAGNTLNFHVASPETFRRGIL